MGEPCAESLVSALKALEVRKQVKLVLLEIDTHKIPYLAVLSSLERLT